MTKVRGISDAAIANRDLKDQLTVAGLKLGWRALRGLPEPVAYGLFNRIADVAVRRGGKRVERLRANYRKARPELDAAALKGALVGTSVRALASPAVAQGAGTLDPLAAAAAEVVAVPATVGFGPADKAGWSAVRRISLRNVSSRRVTIAVAAATEPIAGLSVTASPDRVRLDAGASAPVKLTARLTFLPRRVGAIQGRARLEVSGGGRAVIPWAVALPFRGSALIGGVAISARSFRASDRAPAVLTVQAGQVRDLAGRRQLRPLARLDVELWRRGERLGLVTRLRDVLPGRYAFGLTGRGPRGGALAKGPYRLRVLAVPPDGPAEAETVTFRIR